jgi:hypothetical protein
MLGASTLAPPALRMGRENRHVESIPADEAPEQPSDAARFRELCEAFRATGGIARADDLARLLEDFQSGNFATLAKRMASKEILHFEWRGMHWVPMFQFDLRDLSHRPAARLFLDACGAEVSGWALACWLASPSTSLGDQAPIELFESDLLGLCAAAHARWQPLLPPPNFVHHQESP